MKQLALAITLFLFSAQASWTGRFERVTLYDHSAGVSCQYHTPMGQMFWQTFRGYSCPATVAIP